MPRVTFVKHARQRFEMVPKLGDDGQPIRVPVTGRSGSQKTTKRGREVFRTLTVQDHTKPLPNYACGKCGKEILPGMPYKWIEPKMRGLMVRCVECPSWNVWEYSDSLSARIAQIQGTNDIPDNFESTEDATQWASEVAEQIRELSNEKQEAADNMEAGFGHETEQSSELASIADQLSSWADDLEGVDIPELPEPEEQDCEKCEGTGKVQASDGEADGHKAVEEDCDECGATGRVTPEEPTDEQMDAWRDEVRDALQSVLDESPV